MPQQHSVLLNAFQHGASIHGGDDDDEDSGFFVPVVAALICTRQLFNCLSPQLVGCTCNELFDCVFNREDFSVYRRADSFRFATSLNLRCDGWPTEDLRQMLTHEIDVVQRVQMEYAAIEQLEILFDLTHLCWIEPPESFWPDDAVELFLRLFRQTPNRALRRSIARCVQSARYEERALFAPVLLDALLESQTRGELTDYLNLADRVNEFPQADEVDQLVALLNDYKHDFDSAAADGMVPPIGVVVAKAAAKCCGKHSCYFDFQPFFEYIRNTYYDAAQQMAGSPGRKC